MDEAAASAIREDGTGNKPRDGDTASENNASPSAEDTADLNQCSIVCEDCGLRFTHWDVFNTHLHQHALEDEEEEEEEDEKEEEETGDDESPAAALDSGKVDDGENTGGDAGWCDVSSSLQTNPSGFTQGVNGDPGSPKKQNGKNYVCLVCGKVYTYLVSFRKHQMLHVNPPSKDPEPSVENLSKHECPECGISFIRHARLLGHMRVHTPFETKHPRCEQCDKVFVSVKSWMSHVDLHKRKPFWCTRCTRGFTDKSLLDNHLRRHNMKKHTCNICLKSFDEYQQLRIHHTCHTVAKAFQCTFCGKSFSQPGNLRSHRKKMHRRGYVGSNGMRLGFKNSPKKQATEKKRLLARVKEELEKDTYMGELSIKEERVEENATGTPWEDAAFERYANREVLDCREPVHHAETLESGTVQKSQTLQKLYKSESQERNLQREHKNWECVECDMGFDEVAKLHLHYIKHATGELPMPQYDSEG
ncbi:zinc finger protein 883-like isoform X5 [Clinocottus analis]|uniref:zinc finger protein 883-like isoform X5 n=1 Tax=Clinocottus analis TaxID=304258 RepID=UPI0035C1EF40